MTREILRHTLSIRNRGSNSRKYQIIRCATKGAKAALFQLKTQAVLFLVLLPAGVPECITIRFKKDQTSTGNDEETAGRIIIQKTKTSWPE